LRLSLNLYAFIIKKPQDKNNLLSWHAPVIECINKGNPHKLCEFGRVLLIRTVNESVVAIP
jgi:hypothetical protein